MTMNYKCSEIKRSEYECRAEGREYYLYSDLHHITVEGKSPFGGGVKLSTGNTFSDLYNLDHLLSPENWWWFKGEATEWNSSWEHQEEKKEVFDWIAKIDKEMFRTFFVYLCKEMQRDPLTGKWIR